MDRLAEQILAGENSFALFVLSAPWIGLGAFVGYFALARLRNGGNGKRRANGADSQTTLAGVNGALEAVKLMVAQVLERVHALEAAISALRKENRSRTDSDAHLRERVAAIEGRNESERRTR